MLEDSGFLGLDLAGNPRASRLCGPPMRWTENNYNLLCDLLSHTRRLHADRLTHQRHRLPCLRPCSLGAAL
jgi:hypothetical protein